LLERANSLSLHATVTAYGVTSRIAQTARTQAAQRTAGAHMAARDVCGSRHCCRKRRRPAALKAQAVSSGRPRQHHCWRGAMVDRETGVPPAFRLTQKHGRRRREAANSHTPRVLSTTLRLASWRQCPPILGLGCSDRQIEFHLRYPLDASSP